MKVTLDTNVLISATFWEGEASRIIQLIEQKKVQCFLSSEILEEYHKVLHSEEILEKTDKNHLAMKASLIKVIGISTIVEPKQRIDAVKEDSDDNKVLECAVEAQVDYVVTYDAKHLLKLKEFEGIKIISPGEFLRLFKR